MSINIKPLSTLEQFFYVEKLVIHSLDLCLYQASVEVDGQAFMITDANQKLIKDHSLVGILEKCQGIRAKHYVLRQVSAYDEMIGCPDDGLGNLMEIPIKDNLLY